MYHLTQFDLRKAASTQNKVARTLSQLYSSGDSVEADSGRNTGKAGVLSWVG